METIPYRKFIGSKSGSSLCTIGERPILPGWWLLARLYHLNNPNFGPTYARVGTSSRRMSVYALLWIGKIEERPLSGYPNRSTRSHLVEILDRQGKKLLSRLGSSKLRTSLTAFSHGNLESNPSWHPGIAGPTMRSAKQWISPGYISMIETCIVMFTWPNPPSCKIGKCGSSQLRGRSERQDWELK